MADRDTTLRFLIDVLGDERLVQLTKAIKDAGSSGKDAEPEIRALTTELNSLLDQKAGVESLVKLKAQLADTATAVGAAKTKVDELNASFGASGPTTVKQTAALNAANKALTDLAARQNSLSVEVVKSSGALEKSGVDVTNLAAAHVTLSQKAQDVAQHLDSTVSAANASGKATEDAGSRAREAGSAFGFLKEHLAELVSVAAAVELALKGIEFVGEGIRGASEVEASLSRVKALAGEAADSFEGMDEAIEKAARAVNVDGAVAADGLAKLAANGLNAKDAVAALIPTLQLSKIAQVDVATAAQEVATTLKAFGEPASQAQAIVDKLAVASHGAAGGLGALTSAAATLAPDAKAIGLSLSQTIDVLGFLQSRGLDAEKSLRGLRTIFQDLQNPASELRQSLRALGDDSGDFGAAVQALGNKTPLANSALLKLDGVARSVVQTFGQAGPEALAKFSAQLGNTDGQAATLAAKLDQNLNGSLTRFKNVFVDLAENLGKPILQPLQDELNVLSGKLSELAKSETFKKLQSDIGTFATQSLAALDKFIAGVDWETFGARAEQSFNKVTTNVGKALDGLSKTATILGYIATANDIVSTSTSTLGNALSKIYDVIAGIGEKVKGPFANVISQVRDLRESFDNVKSTIDGALPSFANVESGIKNVTKAAFDAAEQTVAVRENMLKLGLSAEQAGIGVTAAGKTIIDSFDAIAHSAQASAEQVQLSFAQALSKAETEGEIAALKASLQDAFNAGKISADNYAIAIGAAARKTADLRIDAIQAGASLDGIGNAGTTATQKVIAALDALRTKAVADADEIRIALENAIALGANPTAIAKLGAAFDAENAKIDAYTGKISKAQQQLDSANKTTQKFTETQAQGQTVGEKYAESLGAVGDSSKSLEERYQALGAATANTTSATERAQVASAGLGLEMEKNGGIAQFLASAMEGARQEFLAISPAAAGAFDKIVAGVLESRGIMREFVGQTEASTSALENLRREADADFGGGGFSKYFLALETATEQTRIAIENQKTDLANQAANFKAFANSASASLDQVHSKFGLTADQLLALDQRLKDGTFDAGLLGQQDLAPLRSAVDAAIAKVEALTNAEKAAQAQLDSLGADLEDQLNQQEGNFTAIENNRFTKQLADLKAAAEEAGALNSAQYAIDVANANKLHELKLKQIADQAAAQAASDSKSTGSSSAPAKPSAAAPAPSAPTGAAGAVYNITLSPTIYGAGTQQMVDLARVLKVELDKISARTR